MKILFLEDDPVIADIIIDFLEERWEVKHCYNSKEALALAESEHFSLYLFDINVPGISGIELLKQLRAFNDATPAIFITAYQDTGHLTRGFDAGAHDFIRKPFELDELRARIENIKRLFSIDESIAVSPSIQFNPTVHQITVDGTTTHISARESQLLSYLISNKQRVVSADEILQKLWDYDEMPGEDTVRTYVKTLRRLIGREHIINVRGVGYRFE
jgi:two-component system OmpR family response regulator